MEGLIHHNSVNASRSSNALFVNSWPGLNVVLSAPLLLKGALVLLYYDEWL